MEQYLVQAIAGLEEVGAKLVEIKGKLYGVRLEAGPRWTVWELKPGSTEYYVTPHTCSCPSFQGRKRLCKHMDAVLPKRRKPEDPRRGK